MTLAPEYLERFTLRALEDALASATRSYWERRAAILEDARPRQGDYDGKAMPWALKARYDRLTADAEQCRVHGALFSHEHLDLELVAEVLDWPAAELIARERLWMDAEAQARRAEAVA